MLTVKIYYLENPVTKQPFYVGKTSRTLEERFLQHLNVNPAVKSLLQSGIFPSIELIEKVHFSEAALTEVYWIDQFRAWGFELSNSRNFKYPCMDKYNNRKSYGDKHQMYLQKIQDERLKCEGYKRYLDNCKKSIETKKHQVELMGL